MRREDSPWVQDGWTRERWKALDRAQKSAFLDRLTLRQREEFYRDWRLWARDKQLMPDTDWDTVLLLTGRGFGKALALDTPLPTSTGWTTMGQVKVGDVLFDDDGETCRVVQAHTVQLGRPCYRVVFSDGSEIVADVDHLWLTEDKASRKSQARAASPRPAAIRTTAQIARTLMVGKERNHSIRTVRPLALPTRDLPIEPYLLGLWLGDGSARSGEITTADPEILDAFRAQGEGVGRARAAGGRSATYGITHGYVGSVAGRAASFTGRLRALGVLGDKHIPPSYLRASAEQRLALLQGLMDTDGSAVPSSVEFCSTRRQLADGVFELAVSLGMKPAIYEDRARLDGKDCGPRYRVCFRPTLPVFRLGRKLDRVKTLGAQAMRGQRRYIVAVEAVPSVPVRCITVDSPSRLFLAGRGMIATHNTRTAVEFLLDKVENMEGLRIAIVGQGEDDVRNVMIQGESGFIECSPSWNKPIFRPSVGGGVLQWPKTRCQAFIYSIADTEALRGPQFHFGWCDEPMAAPRAQRTRALDNLEFCLRLGEHPQLLITTTPKKDPWLRQMEKDAKDPENKIHIVRGTTHENSDNLASNFLKKIERKYRGTRLAKQEIDGQILGDEEGALWTEEILERQRLTPEKAARLGGNGCPTNIYELAEWCDKVIVSVDPNTKGAVDTNAAKSKKIAHAAGIVVLGAKGRWRFVIADRSVAGGPAKWGAAAVKAAEEFDADEIYAESNQGGEMVKLVVQQEMALQDFTVPVHLKFSTKSKAGRAEPVSNVYQRGETFHAGPAEDLEQLEAQMLYLHEGEDPTLEDFDRCDAVVQGLTRLGLKKRATSGSGSRGGGGIRTFGDFANGPTDERDSRSYQDPGGRAEL